MIVIFSGHDVYEQVINDVTPLLANLLDAQKDAHKNVRTKDNKTLLFIHQCVDANCLRKLQSQQIL